MSNAFSHLDDQGRVKMVDVGQKDVTRRIAVAEGYVDVGPDVMAELKAKGFEGKKGSVTETAKIAGIMGAKQTSTLIPLCHPLGLDQCDIEIKPSDNRTFHIICSTSVEARTGVEMEALTGVSVAALTLYDMCKALSKTITIKDVRLVEKRGGKSEFKRT